ncbi:MAG TPA: helix-turn-helix domain-containing protein [Ignavibacteria bacterium]|nr:helix-turn-helix domain-containing protein [Ignavibacteria bacterium]HMQ97533.1 helix-turn-helix domain-containing protein [Ignavibacteria bacterium]
MKLEKEDIKAIRDILGLKREQLAQIIGISTKTLIRWEKDGITWKKNKAADKLMNLKKILDSPKGKETILDILKSVPVVVGIASVSTLIPILSPIVTTSLLLSPIILRAVKKIFDEKT